MTGQTFTSLEAARRGQAYFIEDQATQDQTVSGRNPCHGLGTVVFTVKFPVSFAGRPVFTQGSELDPSTVLAAEDMASPPWATSMVVEWDYFGGVVGAYEGYYTGATILAIVSGATKEQMTWLTWSFHGPALRNPTTSDETILAG